MLLLQTLAQGIEVLAALDAVSWRCLLRLMRCHAGRCLLRLTPATAPGWRRQEVHVLSQLRHPNIVSMLAACTVPPSICIVEELAEGGSLHDRLHGKRRRRRHQPQPLPYKQVGWQTLAWAIRAAVQGAAGYKATMACRARSCASLLRMPHDKAPIVPRCCLEVRVAAAHAMLPS